ncbi:MAG: hypothetical protein ACJAS1_001128 [Oleiphilaceae bacterium]|jgi:hypothetical protein
MEKMSQKKKLVLNPLPEQTDDYSRYEQTETRWDRIILTIIVVIGLISGTVYLFSGENQAEKVGVEQPDVPEQVISATPEIDESNDHKGMLKSEEVSEPNSLVISLQDKQMQEPIDETVLAKESVSETQQNIVKANSLNTEETARIQIKDKDVVAAISDELKKTEVKVLVEEKQVEEKKTEALVDIRNDAITLAVLTRELRKDVPGRPIPYELSLPKEGIVKVMLFTEMQGLKGQTIFHEWYRNGVRQARVKIPVNIATQRSYSSKFINMLMLGDWQVKVVDENAELFIAADFKVLLP